MNHPKVSFVVLVLFSLSLHPVLTHAIPRAVGDSSPAIGVLRHFTNVPAGLLGEGIAIDPMGRVYVGAVSFSPGDGKVILFDGSGAEIATFSVPGRPVVTGLALGRGDALYAAATTSLDPSANGAIVRIDTRSGIVTTFADGFVFPNGLSFDDKGNLFVTDSFLGKVFKINPSGAVSVFASGPLLEGLPPPGSPFGANGIAFNKEGNGLYVANTARGTIVEIEVRRNGAAGDATIFANGIPTPDGIAFDVRNRLYVAANFANEIWVVSPDGSARRLDLDTSGENLENPASLALRGRDLYITNLALGTLVSRISVVTVEFPGQPLAP